MKIKWFCAVAILVAWMMVLVGCTTEPPRSVRSAEVNEDGKLVITYTDGTQSVLGTVRGMDGQDGKDGADGINGVDGQNGKDGVNGATGPAGPEGPAGINGRGIQSISADADGNLLITYDDQTDTTIPLLGSICLFGGACGTAGDHAVWAIYNGGILVIGGTGSTLDYDGQATPWSAMIPMLSAVYVDTSDGLLLGTHILDGIDAEKIFYPNVWVDMTVRASLYAQPDENSTVLKEIAFGTELEFLKQEGDFTQVRVDGITGYVETRYTTTQSGSVVYEETNWTVSVSNGAGANLRTFPDATAASEFNIRAKVPVDTELTCTGVSLNGRWLRISYQGETLYCLASLIQLPESTNAVK